MSQVGMRLKYCMNIMCGYLVSILDHWCRISSLWMRRSGSINLEKEHGQQAL